MGDLHWLKERARVYGYRERDGRFEVVGVWWHVPEGLDRPEVIDTVDTEREAQQRIADLEETDGSVSLTETGRETFQPFFERS